MWRTVRYLVTTLLGVGTIGVTCAVVFTTSGPLAAFVFGSIWGGYMSYKYTMGQVV